MSRPPTPDERVVCRAHGLRTELTDELWICHDALPRQFPPSLRHGFTSSGTLRVWGGRDGG